MTLHSRAALACALLLAGATAARAREPAFETLTLGAGVASEVDTGALGDHWDGSPRALASVGASPGVGEVTLGLSVGTHDARDPSLPDFLDAHPTLTYTLSRALGRLVAGAGIRAGVRVYFFDAPGLGGYAGTESELTLGAGVHLRYALSRRLGLGLLLARDDVRTRPDYAVDAIAVTIRYTLPAPRWLRGLLQ